MLVKVIQDSCLSLEMKMAEILVYGRRSWEKKHFHYTNIKNKLLGK